MNDLQITLARSLAHEAGQLFNNPDFHYEEGCWNRACAGQMFRGALREIGLRVSATSYLQVFATLLWADAPQGTLAIESPNVRTINTDLLDLACRVAAFNGHVFWDAQQELKRRAKLGPIAKFFLVLRNCGVLSFATLKA